MIRTSVDLAVAHPVLTTFLIALVVRILAAVFLAVGYGGTFVLDDSTYSVMAEAVAGGTRYTWDAYTHELYRATFAFLGPVSFLYWIFGPIKLVGQLYLVLFGAGTAALTARLGKEVLPNPLVLAVGLMVALLPSQVLWSSLILKDAVVWFVLAALAVTVAIANRSSGRRLLLLAGCAAALLFSLGYLRDHTLVVAAWTLAVATLAGIKEGYGARIVGGVVLAASIPWLVGIGPGGYTLVAHAGSLEQRRIANAEGAVSAFVEDRKEQEAALAAAAAANQEAERVVAQIEQQRSEASRLQADLAQGFEEEMTLTERIVALRERARSAPPSEAERLRERIRSLVAKRDALREKLAEEEVKTERIAGEVSRNEVLAQELKEKAAVAEDKAITAPSDASDGGLAPDLAHLPQGTFVMLFEPVPWVLDGSGTMKLARAEAIVWYPILLLALLGIPVALRHLRVTLFPLLAGGGILLLYALTEGNVGTAYRHRGEFVWVVTFLAGLGMMNVANRRARKSDGDATIEQSPGR
jgi:hypothetical protein